jgi:prepilin-type processing-associated H-X9-DG protein
MVIDYSNPPSPGGFLTDMGLKATDVIKTALCDYAASNRGPADDEEDSGNGIVRITYNTPANIVKIQDVVNGNGLSNTLMVGEKRMNRATLGQQERDDNQGYAVGFDQDTVRCASLPPMYDANETSDTYNDTGHSRFGSAHISGFNMAFGDGSVRMISYSIPVSVFQLLGNIANKQPLPPWE